MYNLDREMMTLYIEESKEYLAIALNYFSPAESQGVPEDPKQIQKIFHGLHFVRGGASLLDLKAIQNLAHHLENVFDMICSREMVFSKEVAIILMYACEKLSNLLHCPEESEQVDISDCLVTLRELASTRLPSDSLESLCNRIEICLPNGKALLDISEFDLCHAFQNNLPLYLVQYDLIRDLQRRGKTPLEAYRKLAAAGRILECKMDFQAVGTLEDDFSATIPFYVIYSCRLPTQELLDLLEISMDFVFLCSKWKENTKKVITSPLYHG